MNLQNKNISEKKLLSLTDKAANHLAQLLDAPNGADKDKIIGLHILVKNTGCAGMAYDVHYCAEVPENTVEIFDKGIRLFVDNFASVFLAGSVMDYTQDILSAGFKFTNPNVTGECGCGESFTVG